RYGLANLLISTMLAGVLLIALGALKLGALVRYVPVSIVIGFTNGIAVLIGLSQVKDFLGLDIAKMPADFFLQIGTLAGALHTVNPMAVAIAGASLAVVVLWPKSYAMPTAPVGLIAKTRRLAAHVPGTVVALAGATLAVTALGLDVETIGSRFGGIPQSLPDIALPSFDWLTVQQLLVPTVTIALLGAIESLLCARVADTMGDMPRHDPNQELMAQGVANLAAPLWGGIPATGTIARTVTNVRAGGRTPVAGMVHAATLLTVMLVAAPLAMNVPLAALAGILMFVAWNMGEWHEFVRLRRFHPTYRAILIGTFATTVIFDLTVAVQLGLVLACVFFIWRMGQLFRVEPALKHPLPPGVTVFELYGSLFFGAVGKIEALPARVAEGTRAVVLEMHRLVLLDSSGLDALQQLHRALKKRDIALVLAHVNEQPLALVRSSGFEAELGPENVVPTVGDAFGGQEDAGGPAEPGR
ncbi:MAG: STAS domain-containing protein, partial [Rhodoferax sp.]|nr:STAS domain-containing protein [Rhodoferax sp.]